MDDDTFNFDILDHPTDNLPSLDQVPELNDIANDFQPFLCDPLPSPNPRMDPPFPVEVVDHEQNTVVVDANSGEMIHIGNERSHDLTMLNSDRAIRDLPNSQSQLEQTQPPNLHVPEHLHAHMAQPAQLEEAAKLPRRTPTKRKRRSKKIDDTKSAENRPSAIPATMLSNRNVHMENSTDPILQTEMPNVHHMQNMVTASQQNSHVEMNSQNANIPPSQVNVTHVSHITDATGTAPIPQSTSDTPVNQFAATQAMPAQVQPQPQQNAASLNDQLVPPASPLGSLPLHLQDLLMNQARHRSYTAAEVRAADMAQNAAFRIHSMIQAGEIVLNVSTPNAPRFIIPSQQVQRTASHPNTPHGNVSSQGIQPTGTQPPPKVRRTRSRTSSRSQSTRTPPRPAPTPQVAAAHPQTPAIGAQVVAPPSVSSTPVFSNVTTLPSQDLSCVSSADFRPNYLAAPQHPLASGPTINLEHLVGMQEPSLHGQASSPDTNCQPPVGSTQMAAPPLAPEHPTTPAPPTTMHETEHPNEQRPVRNSSRVHPKTPVSTMHPKQPVFTKDPKQPVSRTHPKQPVSGKHPKRKATTKRRARQAPQHPDCPVPPSQMHYYPPQMMDPTANLSPGAGPSHLPVTAQSAHIAEVAAQAMSATFREMEMMQASVAPVTPGAGSNLAGPLNTTYQQPLEADEFPVPQVPQHPGYPQPQASVPPAVIAAHRRAKNTYGVKLRFSRNAKPSKYCHICGRSSLTVRITDCANLKIGLCRKVLCEKCLIIYDPFYYDWSQTEDPRWLCLHCRRFCPDNARCATYTVNNQKRKERNEEKKREKKKRKLQEETQKELKRRNDDRRDDPGDSPTGVADNVF